MALTPEDVVNKRFQPTKFREGYDQDEVDDFLDEVVVELRRLGQENEELRQRLVASESRISELQRSGASEGSAQTEAAPAQISAPAPAAYTPPAAESSDLDETSTTSNLLQLARRLHEEHVREGIEKRDALIAEGQATAQRLSAEAEAEHGQKVAELERRAAQTEAEHGQKLTELERERVALEAQIDELRTFEREYRANLKSYIEGQLRELNSAPSESAAPADAPFGGNDYGVPANQPPANFQGFVGN